MNSSTLTAAERSNSNTTHQGSPSAKSTWRRGLPNSVRTRLIAIVVACLSVMGVSVISAPSAHASAYSCTGYGWISIPKTGVATSRWCVQTTGSGRYVSSEAGAFTALVAGVYLCDTSMKAQFFDIYGRSMGTYYSVVRRGCWQAGGAFNIGVNRTFPSDGYVRVSLLSYGAEKAAIQHNIKK